MRMSHYSIIPIDHIGRKLFTCRKCFRIFYQVSFQTCYDLRKIYDSQLVDRWQNQGFQSSITRYYHFLLQSSSCLRTISREFEIMKTKLSNTKSSRSQEALAQRRREEKKEEKYIFVFNFQCIFGSFSVNIKNTTQSGSQIICWKHLLTCSNSEISLSEYYKARTS